MSSDPCIPQNSRKAKQSGPDARLSERKMRETGIISYHHAVLRNLTAYFALGGVIVGLRPMVTHAQPVRMPDRADLFFASKGAVMMADSPPGIEFEDIPLDDARRMGRGPRMDPLLYDSLRTKILSLTNQAALMPIGDGVS